MRTTVQIVRTSVLIFILAFASTISQAQSIASPNGKLELGLGLGPLFFLGDLGGGLGRGTKFVKDVNLPFTKMAKGLFLNYYPAEWVGLRLAGNLGTLEGADSVIKDGGGEELYRKARNLHFRSKISELYAAIEFYPTVFFEQYEGLQGKFRPYGVIGIGTLKFNPQAEYYAPNGTTRWVDLQPLRLEGQGMTEYPDRPIYKLSTMEIPIGAGFKYYIKDNMYVGFEVMHRKTFSDYIDDLSTKYINPTYFSKYLTPDQVPIAQQLYYRGGGGASSIIPPDGEQRGNSKNKDSYFSSILRFGWTLFDNSDADHMGCPKW